ncbi:MAG: M14 family metallopeptidase [Candidatus Aminicenantales bacterium]
MKLLQFWREQKNPWIPSLILMASLMVLAPTLPGKNLVGAKNERAFAGDLGRGRASLVDIFASGKGLLDSDGDELIDQLNISVVVPDQPNPFELIAAAEIASRLSFESLAIRFDLVKKEKELKDLSKQGYLILVGDNFNWLRRLPSHSSARRRLEPHEGLVSLVTFNGQKAVVVRSGSPTLLPRISTTFFGRYPYLWDIWGLEDGETFERLANEISRFLQSISADLPRPVIRDILYDLPQPESPYESIARLRYDLGEISELRVDFGLVDDSLAGRLLQAFQALQQDHARGRRVELLSFAGCRRLIFCWQKGIQEESVSLDRVGVPQRLLTPPYRSRRQARGPQRDFDLLELLTSKGLYGDTNNDTIPDSLEGAVIVSADAPLTALPLLGIRLSLESAGLAFPVFYPANEVEEKQALLAPLLVGASPLTEELVKQGKFQPPSLEPETGVIILIPQAFPRSNAVAILGADSSGLEKTIAYFSQTFPWLQKYGPGNESWADVRRRLEDFLKGEFGGGDAFFYSQLWKILEELKPRELEELRIELTTAQPNKPLAAEIDSEVRKLFPLAKVEVKTEGMKESQVIWEKEKEFPWEGEVALRLAAEKIKSLPSLPASLEVEVGVSESPAVRDKLQREMKTRLSKLGIKEITVKIHSAYKQGFFWLTEDVASRLKGKSCARLLIRVAKEEDNWRELKRFYSDPNRWLYELYPADEILASSLGLPLNKIEFELKAEPDPVYEVKAFDSAGQLLFEDNFTPATRIMPFWKILPEWGQVKVSTCWLRVSSQGKTLVEEKFPSDLENFWSFYQEEVLPSLHQHVMKKTEQRPTTAKQPYFKQLSVEIRASEPDYRLNLDEEMISSLEAIHDEIYFDTLDYLRGITDVELPERDALEDISRLSAPGNVMPVIYPSEEGKPLRIKVKLEDWKAGTPSGLVSWKEKGHTETLSRRLTFPRVKPRSFRFVGLTWNGKENIIEKGIFEAEFEAESEYLDFLSMVDAYTSLEAKNLLPANFAFPGLQKIILRARYKEFRRELTLPVKPRPVQAPGQPGLSQPAAGGIVPDEIISPEACLRLVKELTRKGPLRSYIAGRSYEGREIPVVEGFLPQATYVSLPRLLTFKPTLLASARQHANEVSATNYVLKLAEKISREEEWQAWLRRVNVVLLPMENPDGAALAYELQKLTPYHSLHAGRYSSLGVDVGSLVGVENPILPEALVRRNLQEVWKPDIYLNLHGYPSHEWVQPFSNYSPYLFRDYWIPKGWFAFYRSFRLAVYEPWKTAGEELKKIIREEMKSLPGFAENSQKFYDRYFRWASRWSPHLAELEVEDGVNLYARRRSSQETKLTTRSQITYIEETPELMDETAHGDWLRLLSDQGLAYLRAHLKYLASAKHDVNRIDEEVQDRVRLQWLRRRPPRTGT